LALPVENRLYLFDSEKVAGEMDEELTNWLRSRTRILKAQGIAARDLIVYYVGHGCFSKSGADYALAISRTNGEKLFHSSYGISLLAETLRLQAGALRKYLILDCCFSAAAYKEFQSTGPLEVVRQKTEGELPAYEGQALRGTALLCASGPRDPAKAPDDLDYTMFSGALLEVLKQGDPRGDAFLNLVTVAKLVRLQILAAHQDAAVRPEVLSPEQRKGDVAEVPLFPNRWWTPEKQKIADLQAQYDQAASNWYAANYSHIDVDHEQDKSSEIAFYRQRLEEIGRQMRALGVEPHNKVF
jgi:hypothetical protein